MAEFSIIPEKDMVKIIKSKMIKNPRYRDTVIIDMRKKLKKVKENIKNCNVNTLNDLCKISNIVDIHSKYMYTDPSFDQSIKHYDLHFNRRSKDRNEK